MPRLYSYQAKVACWVPVPVSIPIAGDFDCSARRFISSA